MDGVALLSEGAGPRQRDTCANPTDCDHVTPSDPSATISSAELHLSCLGGENM